MITVLLDIETAPIGWREVAADPRKTPPEPAVAYARKKLLDGKRKTPADAAKIAEAAVKYWGRASLDSRRGEIVCVGVKVLDVDDEPAVSEIGEQVSLDLLSGTLQRTARRVWPTPDSVRIVAHGGHGFDFPFIWERALVVGRPDLSRWFRGVLDYGAMRRAGVPTHTLSPLVDTQRLYATTAPRGKDPVSDTGPLSQAVLCEALGLDVPDDPLLKGGAGVLDALLRGDQEIVREHCRVDLIRLEALYRRLAPALGLT